MRYLRLALVVVALAVSAAVSACTSGSNTASAALSATPAPSTINSDPGTPSAGASGPSGSSADVAAITTNWEAFFNAKTPTDQRVSLLQNGQAFASIIQAQAGSALAASATAKVSGVTVTSPSQATVAYSILIGGIPALADQTGTAIKENGRWKVADASFCALLVLENAGSTSGLPAACPSGR